MSRNRIFVLTDAGFIIVVIGVSVSPILIVIRELLQEEQLAVRNCRLVRRRHLQQQGALLHDQPRRVQVLPRLDVRLPAV
jgi:hypothetical protein